MSIADSRLATELTPLLDALRHGKRVAIAGHVTPDADCIGSIGALWAALPELGAAPLASLPPESVSRKLQFLVDACGLTSASAPQLRDADLLVAVDTAKQPRLNIVGGVESIDGVPIINIDHHATNTRFGGHNWIDAQRSSTCEMIFELLTLLRCQITPTIATLLFAGMHSDTQGFSLSNTGVRSLHIAHELAAAGAAVHELGERLGRSIDRSAFELLKVIYANTRVSDDGGVAWSTASYDEIHDAGCRASDIDDQVEIPRSIEGVHLAVLLTEGERGKVRINFRGDRGLSVLPLAKQFGGGGHHAAAGAIVDGELSAAVERVVAAARAYLAEQASRIRD